MATVMKPKIIYGTAWKEGRTADLVLAALKHGFRAVDTACQPKHYQEGLVGDGLHNAIVQGVVRDRSELFVQTKYTPLSGHDLRRPLPYDPSLRVAQQVDSSVKVSLANLRTPYIDSLLLHSPLPTVSATWEAWRAMEAHVDSGRVRQIGLSNVYDLRLLQSLVEGARVKPAVIQNRFVAQHDYCADIRDYCAQEGIEFQSFWTLTGNPDLLEGPIFELHRKQLIAAGSLPATFTKEQFFFKLMMDLGLTPLTGTTSLEHMAQAVEASALTQELPEDLIAKLRVYVG